MPNIGDDSTNLLIIGDFGPEFHPMMADGESEPLAQIVLHLRCLGCWGSYYASVRPLSMESRLASTAGLKSRNRISNMLLVCAGVRELV